MSGATAVELCQDLAPVSYLAAGVHIQLDRIQIIIRVWILEFGVSHKEHGRTLCTDIHILKHFSHGPGLKVLLSGMKVQTRAMT